MQFTDLVDFPIEVTQLTPHIYGTVGDEDSGTPGATLSCRAVFSEGEISFALGNQKQTSIIPNTLSLWDDAGDKDDANDMAPMSMLARIMGGKAFTAFAPDDGEDPDARMSVDIKTSNGDALFRSGDVHKLTVNSATAKAGHKIEFGFSISFYNDDVNLYAAQLCMKREDLVISTELPDD